MEKKERTKCIVYSRVTGFLTPISQWNKGKKAEWEQRKFYNVSEVFKQEEKDL